MRKKTTASRPGSVPKWRYSMALLAITSCLAATAQTTDTTTTAQGQKPQPVAFGSQTPKQILHAQSAITATELETMPVGQLEGALYGKLAGLYLVQSSGRPGADQPSIVLRGQNPMVVVDGVVRSITSIDPQQVASITVLKDALATAMFGMRGSNGVILIQTKRGTPTPKTISVTAQTTLQQPLNKPEFLDAYDYATLFNEALTNDGKPPIYSQTDLDLYKSGASPFTHPNVNWYNTLLKDRATTQRVNLNIAGGSKISRYFVDLDYLNQDGFFITDNSLNSYPTNNFYRRYIFRSNVDVNLTKSTELSLNLFGRLRQGNEPGATTSTIFNNILGPPANAYPIFNPNGTLGGNLQYSNNLYGQVLRSGYRPSFNRNLGVDVALKQHLNFIPGLYARAFTSFNSYYDEAINRSKSFAVYSFALNPANGDTLSQKIGTDAAQANTSSVSQQNRQSYTELMLGYEKRFAQHQVEAQLLYNVDQFVAGADLPLTNKGLATRAHYNFDQRFFAEFAGSYMAMNRYMPGRQWGFFPAGGIGWNMDKEKWFSLGPVQSWKWRASYGQTGNNLNAGYYAYQQFYSGGPTYYFQNPSTSASSIIEATLANPYLTWEKANKLNVGADIGLFNNALQLTLEYYNDKYFDLLQQRGTNASSMLGNSLPAENIGKRKYSGFEWSAAYSSTKGKLQWYTQANLSISGSKILYNDEVMRPYPYLMRTGRQVGQPFGFTAIGFYSSAADIANSPVVEGYNPVPGDIKYADTNADGIINVFDETAIGSTRPLVFYGLTAGLSWKGFDFSMVWHGVANRNVWTNNSNSLEFQQNSAGGYGQAFAHHLQRWTPATASTATYPRLTLADNVHNQRNSTFWLKNGSYARLRNVEIGYQVPKRWLALAGIKKARAFVNGANLITLTKLERLDPEGIGWNYPIQKAINFGLNIQL